MHTVIDTFRGDRDVDVKYFYLESCKIQFRRNYSLGGFWCGSTEKDGNISVADCNFSNEMKVAGTRQPLVDVTLRGRGEPRTFLFVSPFHVSQCFLVPYMVCVPIHFDNGLCCVKDDRETLM